jgi:hypothetical protein
MKATIITTTFKNMFGKIKEHINYKPNLYENIITNYVQTGNEEDDIYETVEWMEKFEHYELIDLVELVKITNEEKKIKDLINLYD